MVIFLKMANEQPIGVFDSGVGGLTVAHAIKQLLPGESLVYFGDTAHLPYGDKSAGAIKSYSEKITDFLLMHNAKVVLVACNSASASAFSYLREKFGDKVMLLDVIEPVIDYISTCNFKKIGIIGTKRTIDSGTYPEKIKSVKPETDVASLPTPLFVPMIEEGFIFDDISNAIIRTYLSDQKLTGIDSLILGCTHYPIIRNQISKHFNFNVEVIDSGRIVATVLKEMLQRNNMLSSALQGKDRFFVSDYTDYFARIARMFFEKEIDLVKADIWN
jgi:glutamate racemase